MDILFLSDHGNGCLGVGISPEHAPSHGTAPPPEVLEAAASHYGNEPFEWTGAQERGVSGRHEWEFLFNAL